MEFEKTCPKCDERVTLVENPNNYVFLQRGGAVTKCRGCGLEFKYEDFNPSNASDAYPVNQPEVVE